MFLYVQNRKPDINFLFGIPSMYYLTDWRRPHTDTHAYKKEKKKKRVAELRKREKSFLSSPLSAQGRKKNAGTKHSSSGAGPVLNIKNQFTV